MKDNVVRLFGEYCECGLCKMKFHVFTQLWDDLERFRSIYVLDATRLEHVGVVLKRAYCRTYMRGATSI